MGRNCFSDRFMVRELGTGTNAYPGKAHTYKSIAEAVSKYTEFVQDCKNFGTGEPLPLYLFWGEPNGDEEKSGYFEFPDRFIRVGPRGGIIVER